MSGPIHSQPQAQAVIGALTQAVGRASRVTSTLPFKIQWLRQHRSTDPLQQMQTDAISDLYDVVEQLQQAVSSLIPLLVPDVSGVRGAAQAASALPPFARRP